MDKINNVIKYMNDDPYKLDTIEDDIIFTFNNLDNEEYSSDIVKFKKVFNEYIGKRTKECKLFAKKVLENHENVYMREIELYKYLPFRESRNPMMDKLLIESISHSDNLSLIHAIELLVVKSDERELFSELLDERLYNFIVYEGIDFNDIKQAPRLSKLHEVPSFDDHIISTFYDAYNHPEKYNENQMYFIEGDFGELMLYNKLRYEKNDDEEIIWVSRDIGDGFGYDIAKYNHTTNHIDLYEVKNTISEDKFLDVELTKFESLIKGASSNYSNTTYHVIRVYSTDARINMFDIYIDEDGRETAKELFSTHKYDTKSSKENGICRIKILK